MYVVFVCKQKTAYDMRISDWSSDVCSSDLVQQQGIRVTKAAKNYLLIVALYSEDGSHDQVDIGDLIAAQLQDPLGRITGVGDTSVMGAQYAMRIWIDPFQLTN